MIMATVSTMGMTGGLALRRSLRQSGGSHSLRFLWQNAGGNGAAAKDFEFITSAFGGFRSPLCSSDRKRQRRFHTGPFGPIIARR